MVAAVGYRIARGGGYRAHRVHGYPVLGRRREPRQTQNHLKIVNSFNSSSAARAVKINAIRGRKKTQRRT